MGEVARLTSPPRAEGWRQYLLFTVYIAITASFIRYCSSTLENPPSLSDIALVSDTEGKAGWPYFSRRKPQERLGRGQHKRKIAKRKRQMSPALSGTPLHVSLAKQYYYCICTPHNSLWCYTQWKEPNRGDDICLFLLDILILWASAVLCGEELSSSPHI